MVSNLSWWPLCHVVVQITVQFVSWYNLCHVTSLPCAIVAMTPFVMMQFMSHFHLCRECYFHTRSFDSFYFKIFIFLPIIRKMSSAFTANRLSKDVTQPLNMTNKIWPWNVTYLEWGLLTNELMDVCLNVRYVPHECYVSDYSWLCVLIISTSQWVVLPCCEHIHTPAHTHTHARIRKRNLQAKPLPSFWRRLVTYVIFFTDKCFRIKHFVSLTNHTHWTHRFAGFWW